MSQKLIIFSSASDSGQRLNRAFLEWNFIGTTFYQLTYFDMSCISWHDFSTERELNVSFIRSDIEGGGDLLRGVSVLYSKLRGGVAFLSKLKVHNSRIKGHISVKIMNERFFVRLSLCFAWMYVYLTKCLNLSRNGTIFIYLAPMTTLSYRMSSGIRITIVCSCFEKGLPKRCKNVWSSEECFSLRN